MKKSIILIFVIIIGCNSDKKKVISFKDINFTFSNGWDKKYNIKLDSNGSLYMFKDGKKSKGHIPFDTLVLLDSLFKKIIPNKTSFISSKSDQKSAEIDFIIKGKRYNFFVYGDSCPKQLKQSIKLFIKLSNEKYYSESYDEDIIFRSNYNLLPIIDSTYSNKKFLPPLGK